MNQEKYLKIGIIADIQQAVNSQIKEWCRLENKTIEKRSFIHGDSTIFKDKNDKSFTITKEKINFNNIFKNHSVEDLSKLNKSIVNGMSGYFVNYIKQQYPNYAKTILNRGQLVEYHQPIKFIFYGLHYIDENTVQLQYGLTNIIDEMENIDYVK